MTRIKRGGHKQIKLRSFKNYTMDGYEKALVEIKIFLSIKILIM